jgi:hypothetical protein
MLSGYAIAQMRNGGIPMFKPVAGCFVLAFAACSVHADSFEKEKLRNWHQWRGPEATGVAPLGKPPTEWSETKNIKWKVEIPGRGSASPIIWGDRIFVLTAIKTERKAEDQADQAARRPASEFRLIAHTHPLLAQRDERPESDDRPRDGERRGRGRGDRPGGGFGRGLGGRFGGGRRNSFPTKATIKRVRSHPVPRSPTARCCTPHSAPEASSVSISTAT